jgi:HEPN domain-containing protein
MTDIERIRWQIEALYGAVDEPSKALPLELQAYGWASFAKEYIHAASVLEREGPQYLLPTLQLTGQAIESSLKSCLGAANGEPPNAHDLIRLYELASKQGFRLPDRDLAAIVHLHHHYFQDLNTSTRYKSRFPTKQTERLGGVHPRNSDYVSIIRSLSEQAILRIAAPFREMFEGLWQAGSVKDA